jgi:hypothetical protein
MVRPKSLNSVPGKSLKRAAGRAAVECKSGGDIVGIDPAHGSIANIVSHAGKRQRAVQLKRSNPKPGAQQSTTSTPYARYVTRQDLGSAIRYALAILGMVTPSLLRDVAGRNIAALRQNHYDQVLLPDPNEVHQTLLNRDAKRAVAVAPIVAVPIADNAHAHAVGVDSDASDVFDADYDSEMFDEDTGFRDVRRYMH